MWEECRKSFYTFQESIYLHSASYKIEVNALFLHKLNIVYNQNLYQACCWHIQIPSNDDYNDEIHAKITPP